MTALAAGLLSLLLLGRCTSAHSIQADQALLANPNAIPQAQPSVPLHVREHWMRTAKQALHDLVSPCPFEAFGTAIVNHTVPTNSPSGDLICIGANGILATGNPTLHGEIAGINNCTAVLTDPNGKYRLSPTDARAAFKDLTLYTTAEPCPMCAAAIRWAGFRECVFGTSVPGLKARGWPQFDLTSSQLFARSGAMGRATELFADVLNNETDPLFAWQFDAAKPCPAGCERDGQDGICSTVGL